MFLLRLQIPKLKIFTLYKNDKKSVLFQLRYTELKLRYTTV